MCFTGASLAMVDRLDRPGVDLVLKLRYFPTVAAAS